MYCKNTVFARHNYWRKRQRVNAGQCLGKKNFFLNQYNVLVGPNTDLKPKEKEKEEGSCF